MLVLSMRLHSIYMLRCFNDGVSMLVFFICLYLFQKHRWAAASIVFSAGLAIKMNFLLVLPAIGALLFQAVGARKALTHLGLIIQVQAMLAAPFLRTNWQGYLFRAFDLSREFGYEETLNWRFLNEKTFTSRGFSLLLLSCQVAGIAVFVFTRWLGPLNQSGKNPISHFLETVTALGKECQTHPAILRALTPDFIMTSMISSIAVGMLFARSLHQQFYTWIAWGTPWLLYKSNLHPAVQGAIWLVQEYAWNQYPARKWSAAVITGCLAIMTTSVWYGATLRKGSR